MPDYISAKRKRCYHRVISGCEVGGQLRFLTLTSSAQSPDTCQRSWRMLYMRLQRRGLIKGYIKVPELSKNGKQHLHVLFRGSYIAQAYLSQQWEEIHHAKIIDIRALNRRQPRNQIAGYMAKYMAKANIFRYSWSWGWVWRGFVRDWQNLKRIITYHNQYGAQVDFRSLLRIWKGFLRLAEPSPLRRLIEEWKPNA